MVGLSKIILLCIVECQYCVIGIVLNDLYSCLCNEVSQFDHFVALRWLCYEVFFLLWDECL